MVRYRYIEQLVLQVYSSLPTIKFPIRPKELIQYMPNCRYMSYEEFAKVTYCDVDTVVRICESESGCTQYDIANDRYLIICNNDSWYFGNTLGRQRWTCAHEIGHVLCGHLPMAAAEMMSENSMFRNDHRDYEREADFFASNLLAPLPLFYMLNIKSPTDIRMTFGLSKTASENKFNSFLKWDNYHRHGSWENDICRLYSQKGA